jgi:predicted ATPase
VERVKYLPQKYVDTLCNELGELGSGTFDAELRKIIYTHVPEEDRLGHASMDKYLDFKVAEIAQERARLTRELAKVNTEITAIEGRMSEEFRQTLLAKIDAKNGELAAHDASKPVDVEDPSASEASQAESNAASARIQELEALAAQLRLEETAARDRKTVLAKKHATLARAEQAIENHRKTHAQFMAELERLLKEADADFAASDLVEVSFETAPIRNLLTAGKTEADVLDATLGGYLDGSIPKRREALESDIAAVKGKLGERARLFVLYKEELGSWERRRADLVGAADKPDSLAGLQAELDGLADLPAQLKARAATRSEMTRSIHALIAQTVEEYRRLYAPVQAFVKSIESMDMPLPLGFDVRIEESTFQDDFLDNVNRQSRGTFAGVEESSTLVRNLLREAEFSSADGAVEFAEKIDHMLRADHRESGDMRPTKFADQLKKGRQPTEVLDYLYGLGYLAPRYSLTFNGQEIGQLSPGERGLLLLVFYLLVDKDDIPLVIDQPEENLDNQTIYRVLVTCIKAAKQRRQVIMVTHNPNLAVVCDAEQIIYATHDKASNRFAYISGAVESPEIKKCVVEILEGTEPAFRNRKQKYGL